MYDGLSRGGASKQLNQGVYLVVLGAVRFCSVAQHSGWPGTHSRLGQHSARITSVPGIQALQLPQIAACLPATRGSAGGSVVVPALPQPAPPRRLGPHADGSVGG